MTSEKIVKMEIFFVILNARFRILSFFPSSSINKQIH
ncbi:hypothetical protein AK89_07535 [Enterococcus mundtii CRL35]|nr:hypothetical protein AK89_07535 [Enterococcus mundtii CRL35]